jgi:DNA processing protein
MLGVGRSGPRGEADVLDGHGHNRGDRVGTAPPRPVDTGGDARRAGSIDAAEREAWVVLAESEGVGPVTFARLVGSLGTARGVLLAACEAGGIARLIEAAADADGGSGLPASTARAIADAAADPALILEPVRASRLRVVVLVEDGYPGRLRRVALPPPVLYVRGAASAMDRRDAVAVVGTRRPTTIGRVTAARIADAVAGLGATVVSGLAMGIDGAAHAAAVNVGAPTVAVIGGGHERLYPAAHRGLARRIVDGGGAVVSEFAPQTVPSRGTFPRRNRIISGLADATVVVEAGARSGALTTAAWALEQGRDLFIVPGRLDDPSVAGSLAFLREGGPDARIVAGIPELLDDLGLVNSQSAIALGLARRTDAEGAGGPVRGGASADAVLLALPSTARAVALAVVAGRASVDELVTTTGLGGATVLGALTALEVRGLVVETFGRYRAAGPLARAATATRVSLPRVGRRTEAAEGDPEKAA